MNLYHAKPLKIGVKVAFIEANVILNKEYLAKTHYLPHSVKLRLHQRKTIKGVTYLARFP